MVIEAAADLRLLFVGDVMLGRLVNEFLATAEPAYPWGDTRAIFQRADWRACNLECAISDRGVPWAATPKAFHFRTDAKNVAVLKAGGIDAVSLANNHALDFEHEAMLDTVKVLDKASIDHAGAGANLAEASQPAVRTVKGRQIGFIAFTDNEPGWEAGPARPGIFYLPIDARDERAARLFDAIRGARSRISLLIVSAHWGPNWGYLPPPEHMRFARQLIDAGSDIIFGHSGHVFRGVEVYKSRPIIYCAGDFIDDYAVDEVERNDESFIFVVDLHEDRPVRLRLYPTLIRHFRAQLAKGADANRIVSQMRNLCSRLNTTAKWSSGDRCLEISIED